MTDKKTLLLIDVFGLMYKAYFTLPATMTAPDGTPTNAVFGLARIFLKLVRDVKPDYLVPAMESIAPTFRKEEYAEYKAHRDKMPDDLRMQIPFMEEFFDAMGLASERVERFEADDVIGAWAKIGAERGLDVKIITGDRDLLQLVRPGVTVYLSRKGVTDIEAYTADRVLQDTGIPPELIPDRKGLEGDSSDNIPGVKGIGPKTALPLLQQFGTLENIYANLEAIDKPRIRALLEEHRETAFLSRRLGTIRVDIQINSDLDVFSWKGIDAEKLVPFFEKMNMKSIVKELTGTAPTPEAPPTHESAEQSDEKTAAPPPAKDGYQGAEGDYKTVLDLDELRRFLEDVRERKRLCVDLETTGLDPHACEIVGYSLAVEEGRAIYVPVRHTGPLGQRLSEQPDPDETLKLLAPILADPEIAKEGHHLKFDRNMLEGAGARLEGIDFDSIIAAYLDGTHASKALKPLAQEMLGMRLLGYKDIVGGGKKEIPFSDVDLELATKYACTDVDAVLKIKPLLLKALEEKSLLDVFHRIEMPLVPVLARMEMNGVLLDTESLSVMSVRMARREEEIRAKIAALTEQEVNLNSPQQVAKLLFDVLQLPGGKKRSTDITVLEEIAELHPVVPLLIEYRHCSKLRSTYLDALPAMIRPRTGRVHTSFNQTIAATGRLSSSEPNLQNIPIRTDEGSDIRAAFIPPPGHVLLTADYSQIELRLLAHLSRDPTLIDAFNRGQDIHTRTASEIFGVDIEAVTKDQRRAAKTINFGVIYGMGVPKLARTLGINRREAADFIKTYFKQYPAVKMLEAETRDQVVRDGWVATLFDRRRYIPEAASPNHVVREAGFRAAFNTRMQGTAADVMKLAMLAIHAEIESGLIDARMILQVHDELVFETPVESVEAVARRVKTLMETAADSRGMLVPLTVDVSAGPNWRDCAAVPMSGG